jgi:VWFA-related protein
MILGVAAQEPTFHTAVPVVLVPATVTDRHGKHIHGLEADDFVLLEDNQPRPIKLDHSDTVSIPLSVIVLIQANNTAPAVLRKVNKVGSMIEPLVTGARGRAAVLAFGSEISLVQDFTNDPQQLINAFGAITPQPARPRACWMPFTKRWACSANARITSGG